MYLVRDIVWRWASLARAAVWPPADGCAPWRLEPTVMRTALVAALPLVLAYHWLGLLLDELLFPGYRRVAVTEPVFVWGVPRSGTTAAHRGLAEDPHTTTFSTRECLFALSITYRVIGRALARIDARLGRPLGRALDRFEAWLTEVLGGVHPIDRAAPEEDYWALMPILACFILVVPFPDARAVWRLGAFDAALSVGERQRIARFYHRCIQRHLWFHGPEYRFLSKNAGLAPAAATLSAAYPDARVLCCLREPAGAVASQLASLRPALEALHGSYRQAVLAERMLETLAYFYRHLLATVAELGGRALVVPAAALQRDLHGTLIDAYARLGFPVTPGFDTALWHRAMAEAATPARPRGLEAMGVAEATVRWRLGDLYERVDFAAETPLSPDRLRTPAPGGA